MNALDSNDKRKEFIGWLQKEEPAFLAWYIGQYCHQRILSDFPLLLVDIEELVNSTSYRYPHLEEVHLHLSLIYLELCEHVEQERVLFRDFIRKKKELLLEKKEGKGFRHLTVRQLLELLDQEHAVVREGWLKIRDLCGQYQPPLQDEVLKEVYQRLAACENKIQYCLQLEDRLLQVLKQKSEDERLVSLP